MKGEGAALGGALAAAWVWLGENGEPTPIADVADPLVELDEGRRKRPRPEHRETYRRQRDLFESLSRRLRGLEAQDPFETRARFLGAR